MHEATVDRKAVIAAVLKSPHGKLDEYVPVGQPAAKADPTFFAHLLAYTHVKGSIRDAKIALPILALTATKDDVLVENACAHLADLGPREFVRAVNFGWDVGAPTNLLKRLACRYVRDLEADRHGWDRAALRHRASLQWLYAQHHLSVGVNQPAIFGQFRKGVDRGPLPGRKRVLQSLPTLPPDEVSSAIQTYHLPFLSVRSMLGPRAKEPDIALALMKAMSPTELVTNMKWLERLGVKTVPALRAALEEALGKAATSKKRGATLKTTVAAEVLADDEKLSSKLRVLQEKQIDQQVGRIEGNWLVLGDKSASMEAAIETARHIAAILARSVKGNVYVVFFDEQPRPFEATGKSYEALTQETQGLVAQGGTSIGCGLQALADRRLAVEGIALITDGCENVPPAFALTYQSYVRRLGIEPPTVYWYEMATSYPQAALDRWGLRAVEEQARSERRGFEQSCQAYNIDVQRFDLTGGVDYYSLPDLVPLMRVARYALLDEIMSVRLRTIDEVLDRTKGVPVLAQRESVHA